MGEWIKKEARTGSVKERGRETIYTGRLHKKSTDF